VLHVVPRTLTLIFFVNAFLRNVIYNTKCSVIETGIYAKKIECIVKETPCRCVFEKYPFKNKTGLRLSLNSSCFHSVFAGGW